MKKILALFSILVIGLISVQAQSSGWISTLPKGVKLVKPQTYTDPATGKRTSILFWGPDVANGELTYTYFTGDTQEYSTYHLFPGTTYYFDFTGDVTQPSIFFFTEVADNYDTEGLPLNPDGTLLYGLKVYKQ